MQTGQMVRMLAIVVLAVASVTFSEAQTVWNSAADGVWSNTLAWTAGVPDQNATFLTNTAGSYTVTVDTELATPYGNLTVVNAAENTTRLNVNAAGFVCTNGLLSFGQGAEVVVNTGGVMSYVGRTPAITTPFVDIKNGGLWRLDGGTVDFANLARNTPTNGNSYIYIGNGSAGRMEITSGEMFFSGIENGETNQTAIISVGRSTGSNGELVMSGGKLTIYNYRPFWYQNGLNIGTGGGTGAKGSLLLSGDAFLLVSNMINVADSLLATGLVDIAGDAVLRMAKGRFYVATAESSLGVITVRENGFLNLQGSDGARFGSYAGRGILNVQEGGRAEIPGLTMGQSESSFNGGICEINLTGGMLTHRTGSNGYGISLADSYTKTASSVATFTMTDGLLDLATELWNGGWSQNGIILGRVGKSANIGGTSLATFSISGGTVTNSGQFILGGGPGATGVVVQTGGNIQQAAGIPGVRSFLTLGWGGGCGRYTLDGGSFTANRHVFVGGLFTSDLGYIPTDIAFTNNGVGMLRIDSGNFEVKNANLYLGRNGNGTLVIGTNGVCSAKDISLGTNTQSVVRFEFGPDGVGTLTASGNLTVGKGARLEVDTTAYTGDAVRIKLIDCAAREGAFAKDNITLQGHGFVRQDKDEDIWLYRIKGTLIQVM